MWNFLGFIILILVIKGNVGKVIAFIGLTLSRIAQVYSRLMSKDIKDGIPKARKPDILK
jgi:hypothetical protein